MTASGIWSVASATGLVPSPPSPALRRLIAGWWAMPRRFGCPAAKGSPSWFVAMPSPLVLCPQCCADHLERLTICAYCRRPAPEGDASLLLYVEAGFLTFTGRAHERCDERGSDA